MNTFVENPQIAPPKVVVWRRGLVRIAAIHDEEWLQGPGIADPGAFVNSLKSSTRGDVFTFARPLPNAEVCYPFHHELDNVAVAKLNGFNQWWESLPQETRKNVRRSQRRGVTVRQVNFDDVLVAGISRIYNETPIRQGRKFWHYGKSLDRVRAENATYSDRCQFIGAFFNEELIGFIKFVMVNNVARIMQIVSLEAHTDKRPTNALLSNAIDLACQKGASHLIYGKYVYGNKENSPVTEFKRRNGFERLNFPRYYVPLNGFGALAIRCGAHLGLAALLPERVTTWFLDARAAMYRRQLAAQKSQKPTDPETALQPGNSSSTA